MQIIKDWKTISKKHIRTIKTFLELKETKELHEEYKNRSKDKADIGFNVFTLSSDFYYRENFHSDIVKSLLNPHGKHNEGLKYLHIFIELLNKKNNTIEIQKNDFKNSIVEREKHNIDILITDEYSRKAIIIENKINNAVDQQRQLPRYVDIVKKEFEIVAIVYLTLNSSKEPDKIDWNKDELKEINPILKLIPAYESDTSKPNLYSNWIVPSIIKSSNIDSSFLLRHYGNLIKHLNTSTMDTLSLKNFYNFAKENDNLIAAISIRNMLNDFPEYLAIRIEEKYKENCYPFNKIWRYQKRDAVFEGCEINDLYFKLDIWCDVNGYTAEFWETKNVDYNISTEYKEKLEILSDFKIHNNEINKIKKHFNIFEEETLFEFIDELLKRLNEIKKGTI